MVTCLIIRTFCVCFSFIVSWLNGARTCVHAMVNTVDIDEVKLLVEMFETLRSGAESKQFVRVIFHLVADIEDFGTFPIFHLALVPVSRTAYSSTSEIHLGAAAPFFLYKYSHRLRFGMSCPLKFGSNNHFRFAAVARKKTRFPASPHDRPFTCRSAGLAIARIDVHVL
jgi:hypothetical protein